LPGSGCVPGLQCHDEHVAKRRLLGVDGPNRRRLTTTQPSTDTPNETFGDVSPVFTSDGRRLAFIRETGPAINAIYVLPLSPDITPAGTPVRVAGETRSGILGLAWTPDDGELVFASGGNLAPSRLYRITLSAETSAPLGPPEILPFGEQAFKGAQFGWAKMFKQLAETVARLAPRGN